MKHLRRAGRYTRSDLFWAMVFVGPWVVGFLVFYLGPLLAVFGLSFTSYDVFSPPRFTGFSNYVRAFGGRDNLFGTAVYNTIYFVALSVPGSLLVGLGLAVLVNSKLNPARKAFRALFYAPAVVPLVAAATIWGTMFAPQFGLINSVLGFFGIDGPNWLASREWSKPAIVIMSMWNVGEVMVVFLAGLQGVPRHLYEAAEIDGAGPTRTFFSITLPMLTPALLFNFVMRVIKAFQVFQTAYVLTGGGPQNSTNFLALHLYTQAFENLRMGYASALGVVLFAIVLVLAIVLLKWSDRWAYYAGKVGKKAR